MSTSAKPMSPDDVCGICLDNVVERGTLDCCKHLYCFECIKAWTDKSSYCPLCKGQVKSIEARTPKDGRRKRNPALHKIRKRHYKVNFNDTGLADAWRPEDFESQSEEEEEETNHNNLFRGGRRRGRGGRISTTATTSTGRGNTGTRRSTGISGNIGRGSTTIQPNTSTSSSASTTTNEHRPRTNRTNTTTVTAHSNPSRRNTNTLHIIDLVNDDDSENETNDETDDGSSVGSSATMIDWLIDPVTLLHNVNSSSSPAQLIRSRRGRLHRLINYAEMDDQNTNSTTISDISGVERNENSTVTVPNDRSSTTLSRNSSINPSQITRPTGNRRPNRGNNRTAENNVRINNSNHPIATNGDYLVLDTNNNETEEDAIARLALYLAAQDNSSGTILSSTSITAESVSPNVSTVVSSVNISSSVESVNRNQQQQQPIPTIESNMIVPEDRGKLVWMKDHKGRWVRARLPPGSIVPRQETEEKYPSVSSSTTEVSSSSSSATVIPKGSKKVTSAAQALIDKAAIDLEQAAKQEKAAQASEIDALSGNDPTLRRIYSLLSPLQSRSLSLTNIRESITHDSPLKKKIHIDTILEPKNTNTSSGSSSSLLEADNILSRLSNLLLRADSIQPLSINEKDSQLIKDTVQEIDNATTEQLKRQNRK